MTVYFWSKKKSHYAKHKYQKVKNKIP